MHVRSWNKAWIRRSLLLSLKLWALMPQVWQVATFLLTPFPASSTLCLILSRSLGRSFAIFSPNRTNCLASNPQTTHRLSSSDPMMLLPLQGLCSSLSPIGRFVAAGAGEFNGDASCSVPKDVAMDHKGHGAPTPHHRKVCHGCTLQEHHASQCYDSQGAPSTHTCTWRELTKETVNPERGYVDSKASGSLFLKALKPTLLSAQINSCIYL